MAIIKWTPMLDPFQEMDGMLDMWSGGRMPQAFTPSMDIYQTDKEVVAEVLLPGIDPNNVNVVVENNVLTIDGKSEQKTEIDEKNYYRKEVRCGSFHRSVALPSAVDSSKAKAQYEEGMLKISIPKDERELPKSIKVDIKKK
ncbi:Hsp20/alpha crystallin family protein [Patescibacteria group bacterium]|nr:Hsp20/alpha crystallin family protein [Patescibacteria group bacterium]